MSSRIIRGALSSTAGKPEGAQRSANVVRRMTGAALGVGVTLGMAGCGAPDAESTVTAGSSPSSYGTEMSPRTSAQVRNGPAPFELESPAVARGLAAPDSTDSAAGVSPRGIYYGDSFAGQLAMTFDDGPHPVYTPEVLQVLAEENVQATFYVTAVNAQQHPELVREIVAQGHSLGNHSENHEQLSTLTPNEVVQNLAQVDAAVDAALGWDYALTKVRPPYGDFDAQTLEAVGPERSTILWTFDSLDWDMPLEIAELPATERCDAMTDLVVTRLTDPASLGIPDAGLSPDLATGGPLLMHDVQPCSPQAAREVIQTAKEMGYSFVSEETMLAEKYGNGNG